jgi:hypothetical protein
MTLIATMNDPIEFNGKIYDQRHGGAFDRGAADSYYGRARRPHYFTGATYSSQEILLEEGAPAYDEYMAGYDFNEQCGDRKNWG